MAPIFLDEVNVFTFPHSRMRKLMNCCTSKVGHTDFTCNHDLEELLQRLQRVFTEFVAHEEIENHFVMGQLKKKLKQQSTADGTELVCNCHTDDRFTPLLALFRDGYAFIRRGNADRMSYGVKLHKAMKKFYEDFLPHMDEEEKDIQPLLSKYFDPIELKVMRIKVIKMTLQKRHHFAKPPVYEIERPLQILVISCTQLLSMENLSDELLQRIFNFLSVRELKQSCLRVNKQWNQCAQKVLDDRTPIYQLPTEILLRLFQFYLTPYDLLHTCGRVNKHWRNIAMDRTIWTTVNPINWARGQWDTNVPLDQDPTIDEHEYTSMKTTETRILTGFIKYFLPDSARSIKNLILYGSLTLTDNSARKIFDACPNLKHLNIGMTNLSSRAFKHFRSIGSLETLIVEGCESMDDGLFSHLTCSSSPLITIERHQQCMLESLCCIQLPNGIKGKRICQLAGNDDRLLNNCRHPICDRCHHLSDNIPNLSTPNQSKSKLKILNLSGCYRLTDDGLNLWIDQGGSEYLNSIDLSGCVHISCECLSHLISSSPYLSMDRLYFCDNLLLSSPGNGCQNVENGSRRYCCRCAI